MTPDEISFLRGLGELVLPATLIPPFIGIIVYGLSLPIFTYAFKTFKFRSMTRSQTALFATIILSFLIATTSVVATITSLALYVRSPSGSVQGNISMAEAQEMSLKRSFTLNTIQGWCSSSAIIVSDAVVFWRAWVLFPKTRWIMVLPSFLLLGSLGTCIGTNILASDFGTWLQWTEGEGALVADTLNLANGWFSFATNLSCTVLVSIRLWKYNQFLKKNSVLQSLASPVHQTLFAIVESGAVFCFVQAAGMTVQHLAGAGLIDDPSYLAYPCILQFIFSLSAAYPAAVIALVQKRKETLASHDQGVDTLYDRAVNHLPKSFFEEHRVRDEDDNDSEVTVAGERPQLPPLNFSPITMKAYGLV